MLDDETMRTALGAVALTVLVLFYVGVYRPTRSSYSGWWSMSLLLAGIPIFLLIFDAGAAQAVTYPLSAALAAAGSTCVWFAARSLRSQPLPRWLLVAGPVAIAVMTVIDTPDESASVTTGPVTLYMAASFVAGATEAWLAWQERRAIAEREPNGEALVALLVISIAATALSGFYVLRLLMFVIVGPNTDTFIRVAGSGTEDVALLVCMVAFTFSVSAVGWDQQTQKLRRRAMQDDLTGLLGRTEFRAQVERALVRARSAEQTALLAVADLDHFKDINDTHGHAAGDRALMEYAAVLTSHLKAGERAGRLGGEEFGLVLLDVDDADALGRLRAISDAFAARAGDFDFPLPTVSYGFAGADDGDSVAQIFERADLAMYVAKAQGRDRAVRYTEQIGRRPSNLAGRRRSDWDDLAGA